jgi:predicted metallo-beta-lactamase superfamily hydrolase
LLRGPAWGCGEKADVIIITHYHYDHHNPRQDLEAIYRDKLVIAKDYRANINVSQRIRGSRFHKLIEGLAGRIEVADGRSFRFGDTVIECSKPVFHGLDDRLGYVVEVYIEDSEASFLYTSDVEGPAVDSQLDFILSKRPEIVYVDGPMIYMLGQAYSDDALARATSNLTYIASFVKALVLDHHLLRDYGWMDWMHEVFEVARNFGTWVGTAAEFMGLKPLLLEACRKKLYEEEG